MQIIMDIADGSAGQTVIQQFSVKILDVFWSQLNELDFSYIESTP